MSLIAHYINRGHTLEEMVHLTELEKQFYLASLNLEVEMLGE